MVILLSPVGKLLDSTVEEPPPLETQLGLAAPALSGINGPEVSASCPAESLAPVEAVAVFRVVPPLLVAEGSGASKGTIARSVVVVTADLAADLAAALEAAAALASFPAASLTRFLSATSSRFRSSASNSWGALRNRFRQVVALVEAQISVFFCSLVKNLGRELFVLFGRGHVHKSRLL